MNNGLSFNTTPQNTQNQGQETLSSDDFFPVIDLNRLRREMRIDNSITSERLYFAASEALIHVNRQLQFFRDNAISIGRTSLAETNSKQIINGESLPVVRYRYAVYNYTKALLEEQYSDYDATGKSAARADAKQQNADDYRRQGHYAIADILNKPRIDSELL